MSSPEPIERVFREEYARIVATLVRRFGDIDVAEDAAGEALVLALEKWPVDGVPPNPGGWLATTAGNKAIDRLRREGRRHDKHRQAAMEAHLSGASEPSEPPSPTGPVTDDRLRLVFTCCHPALAPEMRVALTLRLVAGLTVPEIASAFLVQEATLAQRLTRAKAKIKAARIPYRVPQAVDLPARRDAVLAVVYLVFNEGYLATTGEAPIRSELCSEAVRLARLLRELLPTDPEVAGLLALMLLTEARRPARLVDGILVPLDEQDRSAWDRAVVAEGHALVRECLARNRPGRYQLMAAINAVHTEAAVAADTDWGQIATLYSQLYAVLPTPVVALNRAIAVAELDGAAVGLALLEPLALTGYHPWHAARADLLRRVGRIDDARAAYDAAIAGSGNAAEQDWLGGRCDSPLTRTACARPIVAVLSRYIVNDR